MTLLVLLALTWAADACELKNRTKVPASYQALTVEALLKARQDAYPVGAAGRLRGFVASVRKEADGDYHVGISSRYPATRAQSVVCEITPRRPLPVPKRGARVTVEGWLFWDGHHLHEPGRGTCWEIHPVTRITEDS